MAPVIKDESSDAMKAITFAISLGFASLLIRMPSNRRASLAAAQFRGVEGDADDELGVGLAAPQGDVLEREIDGKRIRHLVFQALEE